MINKSIHSKLYHRIIARLRAKREGKGLTQCQLAHILNVRQTYVSRIETCERRLDILELMNICEALGISFIDFVREIDEDILPKFRASQNGKNN
ncbi:helix-turn-helix domain-containing protein [Segatella copri]|jgi:transcriptional regulator with XRE-family HTH domain|uniref:helix-turn-helix domain-containing protein n=1 Tax=Segatella copri TaxID=165179 RepID=UPI002FF1B5EF